MCGIIAAELAPYAIMFAAVGLMVLWDWVTR